MFEEIEEQCFMFDDPSIGIEDFKEIIERLFRPKRMEYVEIPYEWVSGRVKDGKEYYEFQIGEIVYRFEEERGSNSRINLFYEGDLKDKKEKEFFRKMAISIAVEMNFGEVENDRNFYLDLRPGFDVYTLMDRFGVPDSFEYSEDLKSFDLKYDNVFVLTVSKDTGKVKSISIEYFEENFDQAIKDFKKINSNTRMFQFIGKDRAYIIEKLGAPGHADENGLMYYFSTYTIDFYFFHAENSCNYILML